MRLSGVLLAVLWCASASAQDAAAPPAAAAPELEKAVASAIRGGACLIHGLQMKRVADSLGM